MTSLQTHFVNHLSEFYGKNPLPGFAAKLANAAEGLSDEMLVSVAERLTDTRSTFPSVSDCRSALLQARKFASRPVSTDPRPWDTKARDAAEWRARKEACKICRCQLGEEADREGWLVALIDFATDHGRLPHGYEIQSCKAQARRSEDALERARSCQFFHSLVTWRRNMLERAHLDVFGPASTEPPAREYA